MTKRTRRNYEAVFKAEVALEAIKGEQTFVELTDWRQHLLDRASEIFEKNGKYREPDVKELHAKIGQLAMENEFLAVALGRIDGGAQKNDYQGACVATHKTMPSSEPLPVGYLLRACPGERQRQGAHAPHR